MRAPTSCGDLVLYLHHLRVPLSVSSAAWRSGASLSIFLAVLLDCTARLDQPADALLFFAISC